MYIYAPGYRKIIVLVFCRLFTIVDRTSPAENKRKPVGHVCCQLLRKLKRNGTTYLRLLLKAGCKWYGICTFWVENFLFEVIL